MSRNPLHVSGMNQEAFERLKIKDKRFGIVPTATHEFFSFWRNLSNSKRLRTLAFFVF
jgi:hypothetical protein